MAIGSVKGAGLRLVVALAALAVWSGCAHREHMQEVPTPTPEVMLMDQAPDVVAAQPEAAPEPAPAAPIEIPTPAPTAVPTVVPAPQPKPHYVVKEGDTLWSIAGESEVLGDPFRWPLLYKSNRDQIEDPDLIYPAQDLGYESNYPKTEVEDAVGKAKETPPFQPHAMPRRQLPVKY